MGDDLPTVVPPLETKPKSYACLAVSFSRVHHRNDGGGVATIIGVMEPPVFKDRQIHRSGIEVGLHEFRYVRIALSGKVSDRFF